MVNNASLKALFSAALLLASLGAVTATPTPQGGNVRRVNQGDVPAGSQLCGAASFCQILSRGQVTPSCTFIPDGCCVTVPAGNTVPNTHACQPPPPPPPSDDSGDNGDGGE
ncbi:hypothetical protein GP486_005583, partial [Trichoglossum hirsutum]